MDYWFEPDKISHRRNELPWGVLERLLLMGVLLAMEGEHEAAAAWCREAR